MDAFEILVVVLSITLAILLVITIIFVVALTKLVNQVRLLTEKAEDIVDDVETVSNFFKQSTVPVALASLVSNIVNAVTGSKNKRGK